MNMDRYLDTLSMFILIIVVEARMKYAEKIEIVIKYILSLEDRKFVSPTEIGGLFGGHSSIGSPLCLRMVKQGLLVRNDKGHYRLRNREVN